jgi:hypothetical protein
MEIIVHFLDGKAGDFRIVLSGASIVSMKFDGSKIFGPRFEGKKLLLYYHRRTLPLTSRRGPGSGSAGSEQFRIRFFLRKIFCSKEFFFLSLFSFLAQRLSD